MKKYILYITIITLIKASSGLAQKQTQLIVGQNIQVSNDGNFLHAEMMLAANPKDPNNLIGCSSTFPILNEDRIDKLYVTKDGGKNWNDITLPEEQEFGGADPQIAFGLNGTAYFVGIIHNKNEISDETLYCYRSLDGGTTWEKPYDIGGSVAYGLPRYYDHEQLAVDQTVGKFSGRVYITALTIEDTQYTIWLFRSEDDGKSFIGPIKIITGEKEWKGIVSTNLLVSSTGILYITYVTDNARDPKKLFKGDMYMVSSNDGGVTFSAPKKIAQQNCPVNGGIAYPQYAINNKSENYRDRLYCVFPYRPSENAKTKIMFTYSKDGGNFWSKPKLVDSTSTGGVPRDQSTAIVINSHGVVGIRWFDKRNIGPGELYNEYFAASVDGGDTFLPSVRVSSETSKDVNFINEFGTSLWRRSIDKEGIILSFLNAKLHYWNLFGQTGGHYTQFTSDAKGIFHDFWSDSRDGKTFHIYTSAIEVKDPNTKENNKSANADEKGKKEEKTATTNNKNLHQLSKFIYLQVDPITYDTITNILSVPIRIKNISDKPIYGPLKLEITRIDTSNGRNVVPIILNSDNQLNGPGAVFNYTVNSATALQPNEETATITWRFQVTIPKTIKPLNKTEMKIHKTDKNYQVDWHSETISDLHINVMGYMAE